jgi:hypothetical protein
MSKVLRIVGTIASVAAVVVTPFNPAAGAALAAVGTVASIGAQITAKPPRSRVQGTLNETVVGANQPMPYLMGETYSGGVMLHEAGWGDTLKKAKNPYYFRAMTFSFCGPVEELVGFYADFDPITLSGTAATGFYSGFMWADVQLGATPEANALAPQWPGCPDWGSDYKLSGHAAIGVSLLFDKDGERFASGQPQFGTVWKGVLTYDARLDSTYPGGSGPCRIYDESTWVYSECPAWHAVAYGYGRYQNDVKVFGVDLGDASIDLAGAVAWANVCDVNGWKVGGTIYEPGDKWNNLKLICQAGACEPVLAGGMLSWHYQKPHVSLKTITAEHLAGGELEVPSNLTWKSRRNTIVPKWRSAANQWNFVQSTPVSKPEWVAEDGEVKEFEQEFQLVQDKDQAAQLAAYQLAQERGRGVITLQLKPEFMVYEPGDGLTIDIPEAGLEMEQVIVRRRPVAPDTGIVSMSFITREPDVDAWALAQGGTAPPATDVTTPQERDEAAGNNQNPGGYFSVLIANSFVANAGGVGGSNPITATNAGSDATIVIAAHDRVYADKTVACSASTITGAAYSTTYLIYYDDGNRVGGAVSYQITTSAAVAYNSATYPDRHFVGFVTTPASGGGGTTGGGSNPPGWGGGPIP